MKVRWKRGAAPRFARSLRRARGYYGSNSDDTSCVGTLLLFLLLILMSSGGIGLLFAAAVIVSITTAVWSFLTSPTGIIIAASAVACVGIVIAVLQWKKHRPIYPPPLVVPTNKEKLASPSTDLIRPKEQEQREPRKTRGLKTWQRIMLFVLALLDFAVLGTGFMVLLTSTSH